MSVRIMIVDDHEVVRIGLKTLFETYHGFEVVGEAKNASEALEKARCQKPEIILLDLRLPDASGIEVCRKIIAELPETKVLMLTSFSDKEAVIESIVAGASGYILKKIWSEELINSVKKVSEGKSLLDCNVTASVMEYIKGIPKDEPEEMEQLTQQEKKVLDLIAQAKTNKQIAEELYISEKTVRNYVSSILRKLKLDNRSEAVIYGRNRKWLTD